MKLVVFSSNQLFLYIYIYKKEQQRNNILYIYNFKRGGSEFFNVSMLASVLFISGNRFNKVSRVCSACAMLAQLFLLSCQKK